MENRCLGCKRIFEAQPSHIKSGRSKFCSRTCRYKYKFLNLKPDIAERFNKFCGTPTQSGCIPWIGCKISGYGQLMIKLPKENRFKNTQATHVAYWLIHDVFPKKGQVMCHACDNRACVNIDHLFIGSQKDNIRDAVNKGRMAKGEQCGRSKFTEQQVKTIRRLYPSWKINWIAKRYGVTFRTIALIVRQQSWTHI